MNETNKQLILVLKNAISFSCESHDVKLNKSLICMIYKINSIA